MIFALNDQIVCVTLLQFWAAIISMPKVTCLQCTVGISDKFLSHVQIKNKSLESKSKTNKKKHWTNFWAKQRKKLELKWADNFGNFPLCQAMFSIRLWELENLWVSWEIERHYWFSSCLQKEEKSIQSDSDSLSE